MSSNIEGKVVVITGASSGLGEATARSLAAEGATVGLGARRADRIQALAEELIPTRADQNRWAQSRSPMDMMRQGWLASLFQASQQCATMSS
jgi:NADP-dependent 3-hydroxy acid dehydrogenase YdfG